MYTHAPLDVFLYIRANDCKDMQHQFSREQRELHTHICIHVIYEQLAFANIAPIEWINVSSLVCIKDRLYV